MANQEKIIEGLQTIIKYYQDEEENMYWGQQQLELIERLGKQNWLIQQL